MEKRKLILFLFIFISLSSVMFSTDKDLNVVASTSWTAAFVDIAGVDDVTVIAPSNLRHPPEYEITVSDVLNITNSDYFVYAGFERMMKTLKDTLTDSKTVPIQIKCDNSLSTVRESSIKIAKELGTEEECEKRLKKYEETLTCGKEKVKECGMAGSKVLCHKHQIYLAKELGLDVVATFGPGPVSAKDIMNAKNNDYDLIIDNIHNPVGEPLKEVSDASYVVWRNFPEKVMKDSLINLVTENVELLLK